MRPKPKFWPRGQFGILDCRKLVGLHAWKAWHIHLFLAYLCILSYLFWFHLQLRSERILLHAACHWRHYKWPLPSGCSERVTEVADTRHERRVHHIVQCRHMLTASFVAFSDMADTMWTQWFDFVVTLNRDMEIVFKNPFVSREVCCPKFWQWFVYCFCSLNLLHKCNKYT